MPVPGRLYLLPSSRTVLFLSAGREGDECQYWPAADEPRVPVKESLVRFAHGWLDRNATLLPWGQRTRAAA